MIEIKKLISTLSISMKKDGQIGLTNSKDAKSKI